MSFWKEMTVARARRGLGIVIHAAKLMTVKAYVIYCISLDPGASENQPGAAANCYPQYKVP
ncbi:MAG: hypothetical protein KGH72_04360 [Candidatus Micrarchaeota archaeon]|nr:hypothetical protein [Candidatus Micrarchaeota archaeon]